MINKLNKTGGMTDIFLFMVIAIVVVFICGVFIFLGGKVYTDVEATIGNQLIVRDNGTVIANTSDIISNSLGAVNQSYQALYWISVLLIVGMIISIFIGSYMVTTKPVFFIPYLFIVIIAVIVSVGISNAYEMVKTSDNELSSIFNNSGFNGSNYILEYLPMWVVVISIVGAIIMFTRMGSRESQVYAGGYYGG